MVWASRNALGIGALVVVLSVFAFGLDLHSNGALGLAAVALAACIGAFMLPSKWLKIAALLVAVGFGGMAARTRSAHIDQVAQGRAYDDGIETASYKIKADDAVRLAILRSLHADATGDGGVAVDRLDAASLARFATEYGKSQGRVIAGSQADMFPFYRSHSCGMVFSVEYRLHGQPAPAPTVAQAETWLQNDFYNKGAPRPPWLDAVSSTRPAATGEDALPACVKTYSAAEQVRLAK